MAQENCLSADGSRQHATGDSVRIPGGPTWRPGRRRSRRGDRGHLLGYGRASRSHGQRGSVATFASRMVPGHHLLFSGDVFLLQDADVKKRSRQTSSNRKDVCPADGFKYYFRFTSVEILGYFLLFFFASSSSTIALAAAKRATRTRNVEQLT